MKSAVRRRIFTSRLYGPIIVGIFSVAVLAVPMLSVRSSNLKHDDARTDRHPVSMRDRTAAQVTSGTMRSLAAPIVTSTPETVATFAADCTTAKSTFTVGEAVCAKTNSVSPLDGSWWVNWIYLGIDTIVVNGGDHVNPVTTNPQTFTYTPTTAGSYKVSLSNVPGDISQTPAGFTVTAAPTPVLATYSADCSSPQTDFYLGNTVCVKVSGLSNEEFPNRRVQLATPGKIALFRANVTDNSQQFTYTLPSAASETANGETINHVGTWSASLIDPDANITNSITFVTHKLTDGLLVPFADLQLAKVSLGDPVEAGQLVSFQIFVINQGPDPATSINLNDFTLPNTTFDSFARNTFIIGMNPIPDTNFGAYSAFEMAGDSVFLRDPRFGDLAGAARFPHTLSFLQDTPVTFTCTTPGQGEAGTTTCTTPADQPFQPGDTAVFTVVYKVNANISNGTSISDPHSATIATTSAADPEPNSNNTSVAVVGSNPAPPACTLTCPGNMTATADTTENIDTDGDGIPDTPSGGAHVSFSATTGTNCSGVTSTPASGSFFPIGTTPVTISSSDGASCDFLVTVVASGSPVTISCPGPVTANAAGSCETTVSLGTPTTTGDNVTVSGTRGDGKPLTSPFPAGITTVHWTAANTSGSESCDQQVTVIDTTPPVINNPIPASADANCQAPAPDMRAFVTDNCACDSQDTVDSCIGHPAVVVTQDVAPGTLLGIGPHSITVTANDLSDANNGTGNVTTRVVTFNVVDTTVPVITSCPSNVTVYLPLNTTAVSTPVSYSAATASDNCDNSVDIAYSQASGSSFPVGTTTVNVTATDDAGNHSSCAFTVTVLYDFTGFFSPTGNLPTLNVVNAGRAIPVKFSLSGNKGLGIFAANSPYTVAITCDGSVPQTDVTGTLTAGGSSLNYSADTYNYVWKTDSSWAGTCRQLVVKLNDGSEHRANFKFR